MSMCRTGFLTALQVSRISRNGSQWKAFLNVTAGFTGCVQAYAPSDLLRWLFPTGFEIVSDSLDAVLPSQPPERVTISADEKRRHTVTLTIACEKKETGEILKSDVQMRILLAVGQILRRPSGRPLTTAPSFDTDVIAEERNVDDVFTSAVAEFRE